MKNITAVNGIKTNMRKGMARMCTHTAYTREHLKAPNSTGTAGTLMLKVCVKSDNSSTTNSMAKVPDMSRMGKSMKDGFLKVNYKNESLNKI